MQYVYNNFSNAGISFRDVRMSLLLEPYMSPRDKATFIQNVTLPELQDFTQKLLNKMYLQVRFDLILLGLGLGWDSIV